MATTIRSLAKQAGVSPATVSLALRNHPRISTAVRKRIQRLAKELNYKPNPVVSRLIAQVRASKTTTYQSTLALVFAAEHLRDTKEATVKTWVDAVEERATQLGYNLDRFTVCEEKLRPERLISILDARGIQGIILTGPFPHNRIDAKYNALWERSAAIVLGERPVNPALSCVINNQVNTVVSAIDHAHKLGYQRPALCVHPDIDDILEHRLFGGFAIQTRQLPKRNEIPPFPYKHDGREAFSKWYNKHKPDVILTLHAEIKQWLTELKVMIPKQVGLIHLDYHKQLGAWAGMKQNHEHVGQAAVDMLIGQLHRNEIGLPPFQKCIVINSSWKMGATVKAPGAKSSKA